MADAYGQCIETHGPHSVVISLSIKEFQAQKEKESSRSGPHPAPPQLCCSLGKY